MFSCSMLKLFLHHTTHKMVNQQSITSDLDPQNTILIDACIKGNLNYVQTRVEQFQATCEDDGVPDPSLIFIAAKHGHLIMVQYLVQNGYPWNSIDAEGKSAGEYANQAGHTDVYEWLVDEGVRSERLFACLRKMCAIPPLPDTNIEYLHQKLTYSSDRLLDESCNAVMMDWEGPIMQCSVTWLMNNNHKHLRVLNVGYGLGIIDLMFASHPLQSHHIIEAHPDVLAHINVPNCTVHSGTWQEIVPTLIGQLEFDVIYFDTYAEYYEDLCAFHAFAYKLLAPNGRYSFFHGGGATCPLFNEVYKRIAHVDLESLGFSIEWETLDLKPLGDSVWHNVRQKYYLLDHYHLPMAIKPSCLQ